MKPPFGHNLWLWFASNPAAQIGAAIIAGLGIWKVNNHLQRRRGARDYQIKAERQARKQQSKQEDITHEKMAQATAARDAIEPGDVTGVDRLSDRARSVLIRD